MYRHLALLFALSLLGCGSPLATATNATNSAHDALVVAHDAITDACGPAYRGVQTQADLDRVDAGCVPARAAYLAGAALWITDLGAVLVVRAGGDPVALIPIAPRLAAAIVALSAAIAKLPVPPPVAAKEKP